MSKLEDTPNTDCQELGYVLAWMKRHVANNSEFRAPKGWNHTPTGTDGWAVAAIPDWDIKQRIAQIEEHLGHELKTETKGTQC